MRSNRHFVHYLLALVFGIFCLGFSSGVYAKEHYKDDVPPLPVRNGFTLELGIGIGMTHVMPSEGDYVNKFGLAPLSLSLGAFITNNLSAMFRMAGTSYFGKNQYDELTDSVLAFYGAHVQYWFNDWWFISGGPGLTILGVIFGRTNFDPEPQVGFGFSVRSGISFLTWEDHSLRVSFEMFPSFFDGQTAVAEALNFEWQWF